MKGERDTLGGGFENPSNGWHALEVDDGIEFMKDSEEAATDVLVTFMSVIDDEEEEGRRVRQGFDLSDKRGRTALATLVYWSKLYTGIEKVFKITDGEKLNEEAWGAKYLDVEVNEKASKIIDAIISKMPGKSIFAKTQNRDVDMKDRDDPSKTVKRTFCNILKIRHYGDKEVLAEMKGKKGKSGKPAEEVKTDTGTEEDWPDDKSTDDVPF